MARFVVGVDTGKRRHRAAVYDTARATWAGELTFSVSREGFDRFVAFVGGFVSEPAAAIGVEAAGHYHLTLVEHLRAAGWPVVLLDPYRATQFRRSEGHRAKTDRLDARALARFLAGQPGGGRGAGAPPAPRLAALRELTRFRVDLVRDRTAVLNGLRAALDLAFPELLSILRLPDSPTLLALLAAYPTAAALAAAEPAAVRRLVRETSRAHLGDRCTDALLAAAHTSVALQAGEAALGLKVRALVRQLRTLDRELAEFEDAIAREFAALGYAAAAFPVGTAISLATLVAAAGDVRRFPTAKQFVAHFGWCPADSQSGQYQRAHPPLSKAGNPHVRRLIWMLALAAVRWPGPYRAYRDRRAAEGKNKMHTLVAIGRKLLTANYAILKSGHPYAVAYVPQAA